MRKSYSWATCRCVQIEVREFQIGLGSSTETNLFSIFHSLTLEELSQFTETDMFLMDYPSIRGGDFPDYAKNATWNLSHAYIDAYSQMLIYEYPGDGVQAITIF